MSIESWSVYIVRCADGSLYTGIATDVARRVEEHNENNLLGARYTRTRRPVVLVYEEAAATRSAAGRREYEVKQMRREEKEALASRKTGEREGGRAGGRTVKKGRSNKMARALARPIKTARDKEAASVVSKTLQQTEREPEAERRLQALINALEKFDGEGEEEDYADTTDDVDGLPRRRWSDDLSDEA